METQPSLENPEHHQEQETLVDQGARSYECNFCRRGFSNAQALGGHMNIHRKHKANLIKPPSHVDHHSLQQPLACFSNISYGDGRPDHAATDFKITGNYVGEKFHQLPFFDDKPSSTVIDHQHTSSRFEAHSGSEKGSDMSSSETLDLELRLGPEPQDSSPSSSSKGTKKFF